MRLLGSGWAVYLQHLRWKLKRIQLSKSKETEKLRIHAVKNERKEYMDFYKRNLRLILTPGLRTSYSTFS